MGDHKLELGSGPLGPLACQDTCVFLTTHDDNICVLKN